MDSKHRPTDRHTHTRSKGALAAACPMKISVEAMERIVQNMCLGVATEHEMKSVHSMSTSFAICLVVAAKEGTYMDACMFVIARSVYKHRWALVITWGVLTLFFTPPALYLVLRKTAAWLSSIPKTKGASYPRDYCRDILVVGETVVSRSLTQRWPVESKRCQCGGAVCCKVLVKMWHIKS